MDPEGERSRSAVLDGVVQPDRWQIAGAGEILIIFIYTLHPHPWTLAVGRLSR